MGRVTGDFLSSVDEWGGGGDHVGSNTRPPGPVVGGDISNVLGRWWGLCTAVVVVVLDVEFDARLHLDRMNAVLVDLSSV
jgi:hypothetical protein